MTSYPVHFDANRPETFERSHVALRLVALLLLSMFGASLAWTFGLLYLLLPAYAAFAISSRGGERYLAEDAPAVARVLKWVTAVYAYLAVLTDRIPTRDEEIDIEFSVDAGGRPTMGSALLRLLYSIPGLIFLAVLGVVGAFVWLIAMVMVAFTGAWPDSLYRVQVGVMRYQARLLAYHASLIEYSPPFALDTEHEAHPGTPAGNAA